MKYHMKIYLQDGRCYDKTNLSKKEAQDIVHQLGFVCNGVFMKFGNNYINKDFIANIIVLEGKDE